MQKTVEEMKKLAVFFPGIGYTVDKPLMHYSRRLAADAGFEILPLTYSGFPQKVKGDRDKMEESYRLALTQSREMLSNTNFAEYDQILFVGKSIGTIVAAEIASEIPVPKLVHFILYTPLENTFVFPLGDAMAFTGDADPWVSGGTIPKICQERNIPCHVIPDANHSLETGDVKEDIQNLGKIMKKTRKFIQQF